LEIELFKISKINKTSSITYQLVDLLNESVENSFYAQKLQKVDKVVLNKPFRIEKVIKKRTKNGIKESLVKYLGYNDRFNEWLPSSEINS
jgi:hypothetical protein